MHHGELGSVFSDCFVFREIVGWVVLCTDKFSFGHSSDTKTYFLYMDGRKKNVFPVMSKTVDHSIFRPEDRAPCLDRLESWLARWVIQSNGVTSGQNSYINRRANINTESGY